MELLNRDRRLTVEHEKNDDGAITRIIVTKWNYTYTETDRMLYEKAKAEYPGFFPADETDSTKPGME